LFIKLCDDTFVRKFGSIGYIMHQTVRKDRVYDGMGAMFLLELPRKPKRIEQIVASLTEIFPDAPSDELARDFKDFVTELETEGFVATGIDLASAEIAQPIFSYSNKGNKSIDFSLNANDNHLSSADFLEGHFSATPTLFSLQVEITGRCNERCVHCYHPEFRDERHMEDNVVIDLIDQLAEMNALEMSFTGGEALLHPGLPSFLRHARKKDMYISLLTNATLLTSEMIAVLKEVNVGFLNISLYSLDAQAHDAITRVSGSCQRTKCAIEKLVESDVRLQINCPVMKENLSTFGDVLQWGESIGVKVNCDLSLMARTDFSTSNLTHRLNIDDCGSAINTIIKHDNNYRALISGCRNSKRVGAESPVCGVGNSMMCVSANGDFYPCPGFKYVVGNALRDRVADVWHFSEGMKSLRQIKMGSFPQCINCNSLDFCTICLSHNFNESSGDMLKIPERKCAIGKLNHQIADEFVASLK